MTASPDIGGRPARILIVDDERDNRELANIILTWEGFFIVTASSGEEALAALAEEPFDLVLLDVMMPGMNGYQVAARIKANPATMAVPIIIVTALTDRGAEALGRSAGAEGFLAKPLDRDSFVLHVKSLLRKTFPDYHDDS
jgi:DNA-binding response OmpR family regulator